MSQETIPFFNDLVTQDDAVTLRTRLRDLVNGLFQTNESFKEKLARSLSQQQIEFLRSTFEQNQTRFDDRATVHNFLLQLQTQLDELPVLSLQLGIKLPYHTIRELADWIKAKTGQKVLLALQVNPDLLGGTVIEKNGKLYDYSLGKELDGMQFDIGKQVFSKQ